MVQQTEVTIARAVELLECLVDAGDPVMLWGKPGIGKSEIMDQLGTRRKWKTIDFRANIREPVDMRGVPMPDLKTGTTKWFVPDELPRVERDGKYGIFKLDELNTATEQMMAVMMQLVLERRVGDYVMPPGWVIVAAGNRVGDRAAARRMPTALRNRFAHIYIKPDVDAWVAHANKIGVAPEMVAFVRMRRDEVFHVMPQGDENAFPTPRSLVKAAKHVNASDRLRMQLFAAHVGDGVAAELDSFITLWKTFRSLDEIIADPKGSPIPVEPSLRYAVTSGLARIATRANWEPIMVYGDRLPREMSTLLVVDATERDPKLKNTTAYGRWAVANQHITVQN